MFSHCLFVPILKNGEVKVHVKGAKGKTCLTYAQWLTELIGKVKDQQLTSEFYEPEIKARIDLEQNLRNEE